MEYCACREEHSVTIPHSVKRVKWLLAIRGNNKIEEASPDDISFSLCKELIFYF